MPFWDLEYEGDLFLIYLTFFSFFIPPFPPRVSSLTLQDKTDLEHIMVLKRLGGTMRDSYLDDGFILPKKFGVGQPKRVENARILIANTPMDSDKVKVWRRVIKPCFKIEYWIEDGYNDLRYSALVFVSTPLLRSLRSRPLRKRRWRRSARKSLLTESTALLTGSL